MSSETDDLARPDVGADMEAAAKLIGQFRQELLDAGFKHANGAGELASQDDITWISTSYTHGEYSIHVWFRPRGHGEIGEHRYALRIHDGRRDFVVKALSGALVGYAHEFQTERTWPPVGVGLTLI